MATIRNYIEGVAALSGSGVTQRFSWLADGVAIEFTVKEFGGLEHLALCKFYAEMGLVKTLPEPVSFRLMNDEAKMTIALSFAYTCSQLQEFAGYTAKDILEWCAWTGTST